MALKSKKAANPKGSKSKSQVIKVNPYENPENVLELMSKICSATPSVESDVYWTILNDAYRKDDQGISLADYLKENRHALFNTDFDFQLKDLCRKISWSIQTRENTEHTQIVVAGGFSSGKSSFLNRLIKCTNLLPTGVEPVSVVKTYLYCSKTNKKIQVQGVNQKNVLVSLEPGVLQAIQHSKQSNIYLASVLEKLFVKIPSKELDGLVFIDTPGYNNSDKKNDSNGKTDRQTAIEALGEGNVLFWLIDCDKGTTVTDDLDMIKQFNGKKVFIFNKADKKGKDESKKIVENAATILYKEFPAEDIIDILAYSTLDEKIYYSLNKLTLKQIILNVKNSGNGISELNQLKESINQLFIDEIQSSKDEIKALIKEYSKVTKLKNKYYKNWQDDKDNKASQIDLLKDIKEIMIDSYNELSDAVDDLDDAFFEWGDFIDKVDNWDKSRLAWSDKLWGIRSSGRNIYQKSVDSFDSSILERVISEEYRKKLYNWIKAIVKSQNDDYKALYEKANSTCDKLLEDKQQEELIISNMTVYQNVFMTALNLGISAYKKHDKATNLNADDYETPNVFDCIRKDDYKSFLRSFEDGVDLSVCDAKGYNPLTLSVYMGNNAMVQFLLDNNADSTMYDQRGYNAFHTAVENQYRDICRLLLDHDPGLMETKTVSGETITDLVNKQTFTKWIKDEIDNTFLF